jgi:hypothetical protein
MAQTFSLLPDLYALARLAPDATVPGWALATDGFASITRTAEELSIVAPESSVPAGVRADTDWRAIQLKGPFAFDQVGVLSSIALPLAQAGVGIFAISTFDTDYILFKSQHLERAVEALVTAGHVLA